MKKLFIAVILIFLNISLFSQKAPSGDIWLHMLSTGQPAATKYLGDQLNGGSSWYINFEVGQDTWNQTDAGIGQSNTDPADWTWRTATWYANGSGSNKQVHADFGDFRFTATGSWYFCGRAKGEAGDPWHYANNDTWGSSSTFSPVYYFTVSALSNPSSQTATTASSSTVNLSWSLDAQSHWVMIVRKKSTDSWTEPTQGTGYSAGNTIGSGTVVYFSNGTSTTDNSLLSSTGYDYKFYTENNSYYSGGVVSSATTQSASSDYFRSTADGVWSSASTWESSNDNSTWVNATLAPSSAAASVTINHSVSADGNETAGDLTINSGKTLTIASGASLQIGGTFTNNGGTSGFVIQSDATGTGTLVADDAVEATVGRYIPAWGSAMVGWHLLSAPVFDQNFQPGFIPDPPTVNEDFYLWDETTCYWINSKTGSSAPFGFNSSAFGTSFLIGKGYMVSYSSNQNKSFEGTLNAGDQTIDLTYTSTSSRSGWNLLGNPFPCGLSWGWASANTHIYGVAKILLSTNGSYDDISDGEIIPAMNGFFIKTDENITGFTIPASAKSTEGTWYKNGNSTEKLTLTVYDIANNTAQRTYIKVNPEATAGLDKQYDGQFIPFYAPEFYSIAGDERLSTNTVPEIADQTEISLGFKKTSGSDYRIEATGTELFTGTVILHDLKTGLTQDLSQNPEYNFTADEGDAPARFKLTFGSVGIATPESGHSGIYSYGNQLFIQNPGDAILEIYTFAGQRVDYRAIKEKGLWNQPLSLSAGQYIVRVVNGQSVRTSKIVLL